MRVPDTIGRLERVFLNPRLLDPNGIINPLGPFHPVAAWRSPLFKDEQGMSVVDGYDLLWIWSPTSLVARVYFQRGEPKSVLDYWTAEVVCERTGGLDEQEIAAAIVAHQGRLHPEHRSSDSNK